MVIISVFEATLFGEKSNTLLSTVQLRKNLVDIYDRSRRRGGQLLFDKDIIIFLITLTEGMMTLNIRKPSKFEFNTCDVIEMTKYDICNPHLYRKDPMNENNYSQIVSEFEDKKSVNMKLTSTTERRKHIKDHDAIFFIHDKKHCFKHLTTQHK